MTNHTPLLMFCAIALVVSSPVVYAQIAPEELKKPVDQTAQSSQTAQAAQSSQAAQANRKPLEEIVVTARRKEEKQQQVPIAISVLTEDYLRQQNIKKLNDLGSQVPSLRISSAGTSTNEPVISIRGQRPSDSTLGLDATIPIYFNEVVMTPSQGTNLALYDLQSVQVLKGPQGTLFGRNSTGGAILITPKKPGREHSGYFDASLGEYNHRGLEAGLNLPVNDNLQFRLAGRAVYRDGYQENVANNRLRGDDYWDENSNALRLSANVEQGNFSNLTTLDWAQNRASARVPVVAAFNSGTRLGGALAFFFGNEQQSGAEIIREHINQQDRRDTRHIASDLATTDDIENLSLSNISELQLTEQLSLVGVLGYREVNWQHNNDADGTALPLFGGLTGLSVPTQNAPAIDTRAEQLSSEIRLQGSAFSLPLDWMLGAYAYQMQGEQNGLVQALGFNPENPLTAIYQSAPNGDVNNQAWGAFAEGTYFINPQWSLTAGVRFSADRREITVRNLSTAPGFNASQLNDNNLPEYGEGFGCAVRDENDVLIPSRDEQDNILPQSLCARTESEQFSSPTWRASLNWTPQDGQLHYASISTGYRAGGFNLRATTNATLEPFKEEKVITYEVGSKVDWRINDVYLRTNWALYYQDYENIQKTFSVANDDETFGTTTLNAGAAGIYGFELDATAVFNNVNTRIAYSLVEAGYDEFDVLLSYRDNNPDSPTFRQSVGEVFDISDGDFAYIPKHSLTASVGYQFPLRNQYGELSATVQVYWQSEMNTDETSVVYELLASPERENWSEENLQAANSVKTADSYYITNFNLDWQKFMQSKVDLSIYANNLFNEEYIVGGLNVIDTLGIAAFTYGPPRTVGASVRYRF